MEAGELINQERWSSRALRWFSTCRGPTREFSKDELISWLTGQDCPVFDIHLAFEASLASAAQHTTIPLTERGKGWLELDGLTLGTSSPFDLDPEYQQLRRGGNLCILAGTRAPQTLIYIAESGQTFRRNGSCIWELLAMRPHTYVERLALLNSGLPWAITLPGRQARTLAEKIGAEWVSEATDELAWGYEGNGLALLDGHPELPGAARTTIVPQTPSAIVRLFDLLQGAGFQGRVELLRPSPVEEVAALPHPQLPDAIAYWSESDRCSGGIIREGDGLTQWVLDPLARPIEALRCVARGSTVKRDMKASRWFEGRLSELARQALDEKHLIFDPRWTTSRKALREELERYQLPTSEIVFQAEEILGGLSSPTTLQFFGIHASLRRQEEEGFFDTGGRSLRGSWPNLRYKKKPLTPLGGSVEDEYYLGTEDIIYSYTIDSETLETVAQGPWQFLERLGVFHAFSQMPCRWIHCDADAGTELAKAFDAPLYIPASNAVGSFWLNDNIVISTVHQKYHKVPFTRVAAADIATLNLVVDWLLAQFPTHIVRAHSLPSRQLAPRERLVFA